MSRLGSNRRVLTLALSCAALFVAALIVQTTPAAYVRLNLVLHGCAFCQTVDRSPEIDAGAQRSVSAAMYVLRNGQYAGYISRYGEFVRRDTTPLHIETGVDLALALLLIQTVCALEVIVALAVYLGRRFKRWHAGPIKKADSRA